MDSFLLEEYGKDMLNLAHILGTVAQSFYGKMLGIIVKNNHCQ